jgi:hypothetical protein
MHLSKAVRRAKAAALQEAITRLSLGHTEQLMRIRALLERV